MTGETVVLKIGGNELDDPVFIQALTNALVALTAKRGAATVIVHGGGSEIAALQGVMGIEPRYVDGLRVTDEEVLAAATMVLCGAVNKRLVAALTLAGVDAAGLSGVDRGIVRVMRMQHPDGDLGRVGVPVAVRADVLKGLLAEGVTPVLAPICLGPDGPYNVNADQVAGAVASALGATLLLVTNVPGVLVDEERIDTLSKQEIHALIADGTINGGMLPKVRSALDALKGGAPAAKILDLNALTNGGGTTVVA